MPGIDVRAVARGSRRRPSWSHRSSFVRIGEGQSNLTYKVEDVAAGPSSCSADRRWGAILASAHDCRANTAS